MKPYHFILPVALMMGLGSAAVAQDAPAGASATGCDVSAFAAVRSDRTGEILYWTNPTCPAGSGAAGAAAEVEEEEKKKGRRGWRRGGGEGGWWGRGRNGGGNLEFY